MNKDELRERRKLWNQRYYKKHRTEPRGKQEAISELHNSPELQGYAEAFQPQDTGLGFNGGENRKGWIKICPDHGCPLDKNGCPVCQGRD
jgi:hypothetical protein